MARSDSSGIRRWFDANNELLSPGTTQPTMSNPGVMNYKRRRIKRTRGENIYKSVWSFKRGFGRDYELRAEFRKELRKGDLIKGG